MPCKAHGFANWPYVPPPGVKANGGQNTAAESPATINGGHTHRRRIDGRYPARPMARVCHSCGKRPAFGNSRSHSMVATRRRFNPNLQKVRIQEPGGGTARVYVCARCLKSNK